MVQAMITKMIFLIYCFVLTSYTAWGAGGQGIPVSFILFQVLNFTIFSLIIAYFIIKKTPAFMEDRFQKYQTIQNQAQTLYAEALERRAQIQKRAEKLKRDEQNFSEDIAQNIQDYQQIKNLETKEKCSLILATAGKSVDQEFIKANRQLTHSLLKQVTQFCQTASQQKNLNHSLFLKNLDQIKRSL